jgi:RNA polymerase sigma factor (sigma-70 family)
MKSYRSDDKYEDWSCQKVWKELQEGDLQALRSLFLRHHDHLFDYGMQVSSDRFLVEDCIHNLFYRIWDSRESLGEVTSVRSYLWISFRRELFRASNSNEPEFLTNTIQSYTPESGLETELMIAGEEQQQKREWDTTLETALNKLSHRQRQAIYLKYFNGMGYDEIQQIMSINYQTARNYICSGIKVLKAYFRNINRERIPDQFS